MSNRNLRKVESIVPVEVVGSTLISYLIKRFTYWSSEEWIEAIDKEYCKLNHKITNPNVVLHEGDLLSLDVSHIKEPDVNLNYEIVHDEETFMVINKPGDLPVHPGGPFYKNTLWFQLLDIMEKPHLINRLDRETSGLILIAKNPKTAAHLSKQIQRRTVTKKYLTLVEGKTPEVFDAKGYLANDEDSPVMKKQVFIADENYQDHGKNKAFTEFKRLEYKNGFSLVECHLHTGKTHQIRISLHSLGFPLVGDKIYGLNPEFYIKFIEKTLTDEDQQVLRLNRQALHSYQLEFRRPTGDEILSFEIPLAKDMKELLED